MDSGLILKSEMLTVQLGEKGTFINLSTLNNSIKYLKAPVFEIQDKQIGGIGLTYRSLESERELQNGGKEVSLRYTFDDYADKGLTMRLILRYFPNSPFIRYKYILDSEKRLMLTKQKGKDNILYTGVSTKSKDDKFRVTEIAFSQFEEIVHSFLPSFQELSEGELREGYQFPGPIALIEGEKFSSLLAYEHGAEYPDSYLYFDTVNKCDYLNLDVLARKGNYYNGQIIDINNKFESPWFHFALCDEKQETLLKYYREFLLKYICENNESRKPYIFYNTWNNQERNRYYKDLPFLHSMNYEHIMKEIDIAHQMGVDVFVIDTGWFNRTGDWIVNTERFPDELKEVREKLDGYGMKMGLWFNPIVAAVTSEIYKLHPEYVMSKEGKENFWGSIWETEESYGMCLASSYSDFFIKRLVKLNKELGVTYFKWDAIGQYGCDSPYHDHGNETNSEQERLECYSYKMGIEMIKIVEEVTTQCPGTIVDFDVTEGGRFVGLGFLSVGKYFLMNNGPYFSSFDIPKYLQIKPDTINVFFHPGAARSKVCRQGLRYDSFVPSILFLTHFLPDGPRNSQTISLASLMLGGNGIWGDLLSLTDSDIKYFGDTLLKYKRIAKNITESYPRSKGFIGASPEIYEKIDYENAKGIICFFSTSEGNFIHITDKLNISNFSHVEGAEEYEITSEGRLKIKVNLTKDEGRFIFVF